MDFLDEDDEMESFDLQLLKLYEKQNSKEILRQQI